MSSDKNFVPSQRIIKPLDQSASDDARSLHKTKRHDKLDTAHFIPSSLERAVTQSNERTNDARFQQNVPQDYQQFAGNFIPSSVERNNKQSKEGRATNDASFQFIPSSVETRFKQSEANSIISDVGSHRKKHQDKRFMTSRFNPSILHKDEQQRNKDVKIPQGTLPSSGASICSGLTRPLHQDHRVPPPSLLLSSSKLKQRSSPPNTQDMLCSSERYAFPPKPSLFPNQMEKQSKVYDQGLVSMNQQKTEHTANQARLGQECIDRAECTQIFKGDDTKRKNQSSNKPRVSSKPQKMLTGVDQPSNADMQQVTKYTGQICDATNSELDVCLSFKICFEEDTTVEEIIKVAFDDMGGENLQIVFKETTLLPKTNVTLCHFVISNYENLGDTKICLKRVVKNLSQLFETVVSILHIDIRYTIEARRRDNDEHAVVDSVKKHKNNLSPDRGKDKRQKDRSTTNVPVTLVLSVKKDFESSMAFKTFIRAVGNQLPFEYKIVDESITISPNSSKCLLTTEIMEDALHVKRMFYNLRLETKLEIKCYLQEIESDVTKAQNRIQRRIKESLPVVQRRKKEVLLGHQSRIDHILEELKSIESLKLEQESLRNLNVDKEKALTDKLKELQMQKSEFCQRFDAIQKDIKEMDPSTNQSSKLDGLLKGIGIECNRLRNALPIYARRSEIIQHVKSNQVSIILGETGSGKSTQMAQYFHDAGLSTHGSIVCTQPRRVAASTLAERVASEMSERVGGLVGYKVGSMRKSDQNTKIFFTTDSALLNECLEDPELNKYSCIIVDEAHERSIYTDILLGMIKTCLRKRPTLRIIITSATINPEVFIKYFGTGPELRVSGRNFPVEVSYCEDVSDDFENYEEKAVSKALEIHENEEPGDILVFLCSPVEIMRCCEELGKKLSGRRDFKCLPLHGQLPPDEQKNVFEKLPEGQRKIVFSTNCAETSITIDGIKYVIDTGVAKEMKYDPKRNISQLGVFVISKSSADQRKGRAGRTASGKCYRLYSKEGFDMMKSINEPEILRVHLGQAALRLAELGISIESYDFVQAPSETALKSALDTLRYLGAIIQHKITDAGKWIAKLPFDPKLGYLIFKADKINLLYDAVILAAVVSSGSDLFYRGFSETEAQVIAKSKSYFGSEYGDPFTWFNVYKAWKDVEKKEKSVWCRSHCINYKTISYAHQNILEVKNILSKDLGIDMTQEMSTDTIALNRLRKIMFEANAASLCNFSGFARAGYFSLASEGQVYVHLSSILNALDLRPEWIVYNELVKTSKEFIKGIISIEEEWVYEIIASGRIRVDLNKAKQQKCNHVYHDEVGPTVFRAIVGPRFSHLQTLEEDVSNAGMPGSILTASKDLFTIDIHSKHPLSSFVNEVFQDLKSPVIHKLMSEESEFKLSKKESVSKSSVRVVLGNGGCVKNIFMPDQSDKVLIKRRKVDTTQVDIEEKFKAFGEIKDIVQFKSSALIWGYVQYSSVTEAMHAVEATGKDEFNAGSLKLDNQTNREKNLFEVKLTWLRRPVKGKGVAFIKCDPVDKPNLVNLCIELSGRYCTIHISKKNDDDLIIFNTGPVSEEEIKDKIINSLCSKGIENVNIRVTMDREKVPLSVGQVHDKTSSITAFIKNHVDDDSFKVRMLSPKEGSIYYVAFVNFIDPVKGYSVCQKMRQELHLDGQCVTISISLRTVMHVPERIKVTCQENFDRIFAQMASHKNTTLTWKNSNIEIKSPDPELMVMARSLLSKEIEGQIIDGSHHDAYSCLLNRAGQEHLRKIERDRSCLIITDFQKEKIHVYGPNTNISQALHEIQSYLTEIRESQQGLFQMKGHGKPPGLAKLSMNTFGHNLEKLVEECDLKLVNINWKTLCVNFLGTDAAVQKAQQILCDLEERAWKNAGITRDTYLPECSVCICPIEEKASLYRMEICGHAYCLDCLKHQVSFAVNNKEFPLTCARDGCGSLFVIKDLKFALLKKWVDEDKVTSMAVNAFVLANREKFKFCSTPNCPVVYETTPEGTGHEFNCPLCLASICTSCHDAFHQGMTCQMVKDQTKADEETLAWIQAEPEKRKRCPGCQWPIEKIEGCNKMHCTGCNTYFCWVCLQKSATEQECYAHLYKAHGSFI